ncbi:EAL domain-containing protein [Thiorhodococcus mannitoliphagus]|uniref:EAL domain-containing protein n=2 Tax=Thiorhodococcus mannitoliphagus TaxID=329406 RepID=A0A6P1E0H3_9GAMM|nr:EAL domain-containing protein [Thiorhodococcus mannitoliphagus]
MAALMLDHDLSVSSANPVFLDLLGYKDSEIIGRRFDCLLLTAQTEALGELLRSDDRFSIQLDLRFISARGGSLPASVAVSKVCELDATSKGQLSVILERLDREHALQQVLRIDEALSLAQIANWELQLDTGRILAPRDWLARLGISTEEELTLERALRCVYPQDRDLVASTFEQARNRGASFRIRFRFLSAKGGLRWAECAGRRYPNDSGLAGRICGAILDITDRQLAEQALERYADIVSANPDRIAFVDRGCRIQAANEAFLQGVNQVRNSIIGRSFIEVWGESQLAALLYRNLGHCLDEGRSIIEDVQESGVDGARLDLEVRLFPHQDAQGKVTGIVINARDVTDIREAERRLLQSAAVYSATSEGVLITDASGIIVRVNSAFTQITGYSESEILGQKPSLLNSQWHSRSFFFNMWRRILRQGSWQGNIWNRRKDGEVYRQRLIIRRVNDPRGKVVNFVGVFAERATAPEATRPAEHVIHYDALTKLPNRLLFESRLEHGLELGERKDSSLAVFVLDLDHFSHINSSLGHHIGDDLLRTVGIKLRDTIRPADTLARLRADQFAFLFEDIEDVEEVKEIAERLHKAMRAPIWVRNHLLHVNVSIGIALSADLAESCGSMMAKAESALRQVKRQSRNAFQIYLAEPDTARAEHRRLLGLLRSGLSQGDFKLLYRPGVDMRSDVCDYLEAIVQWEQQEFGRVSSEQVTTLADEIGLTAEIGDWALEESCRQLKHWLRQGLPVLSQGIKICERQLTQGDLVRKMAIILEDSPRIASHLVMEFSECLLIKHREQIMDVFRGLNELGVDIMLTEVGIGWTAPAILQRLPIKTLKIHPNFVEALPDSAHELAVVEVLIAMAQSLELDVRADGVRTEAQKYQLMNLGCARAQGELFSEPLTAPQVSTWLSPKGKTPQPPPQRKS